MEDLAKSNIMDLNPRLLGNGLPMQLGGDYLIAWTLVMGVVRCLHP